MKRELSRRSFLTSSAAGWAALASSSAGTGLRSAEANAQEPNVNAPPQPIIDTHQHLWDLSKLRLSWMNEPDSKPLRRNFVLKDYEEATAKAHVVKTVYMEVDCDPAEHDVEAGYVINLCKSPFSRMAGAVLGGSLQSGGFRDYITPYATNPHVKGVRQVLHSKSRRKGMCLERQFVENVRLLGELGLSFDLCMRPGELIDGVRLAEQCDRTRFIVDHCGNMDVQSTDPKLRAAWEQGIKAAAARPNVVCKISGIVVTAKPGSWKPADLEPVVNFCLDAFGPDRVFFGGDWPVCTLRATYQQWVDALQTIVSNRSPEFRRKLFHDNATRLYKLT